MLPDVKKDDWGEAHWDVALLVVKLNDDELLTKRVPRQDCPARTLNASSDGCKVLLKRLKGTELLVDGSCEVALWLATLRGEVCPECGVVYVPTEVEREVLLDLVDRGEVALCACLFKLLQRGVCASDVSLVVLGVVQLHDAAGNVWLKCAVVVRQFWQRVDSHAYYLQLERISPDGELFSSMQTAREQFPRK